MRFLPSKLMLIESLKSCLTKQMILMMFVRTPKMPIIWHSTLYTAHVKIKIASWLMSDKSTWVCISLQTWNLCHLKSCYWLRVNILHDFSQSHNIGQYSSWLVLNIIRYVWPFSHYKKKQQISSTTSTQTLICRK